jgi:hypothetical protein
MIQEPPLDAPPFRFGLRSLLLVVTGICIFAGTFWFLSLIILLLAGVLVAQCLFFLVIQRFANWVGGSPSHEDEAVRIAED